MSMESEQLSRNNERLSSLALGVRAIGTMLYSVSADAGFSDDTRQDLGYLLSEVGEIMFETLQHSNEIDIELTLKNEGKK